MPNVSVKIDASEVKRALAALRREGPKAIAEALNKTAFEILDAEEKEVSSEFKFASPTTQRFLARGFAFDKATPGNLRAVIRTKPGARNILERQQFGAEIKAGDPDVGPLLRGQIAVPKAAIRRGPRGRIAAAQLPGRVLRKNAKGRSRGFVTASGKAVLERVRGGGVRLLYVLTNRARIKPALDFFGVAERTARREFPKKAHRVLEKLRLKK